MIDTRRNSALSLSPANAAKKQGKARPNGTFGPSPKKLAQEWIQKAQTQVANLLNPETLLPRSHREPTSLTHQLASPWQRSATDQSPNKKATREEQNNAALGDWQVYGCYVH
ncbi:MAG: hypothetical protein ACPGWR_11430 [Ardenticatenaceae bacterium]